jgi:hypothetical protein
MFFACGKLKKVLKILASEKHSTTKKKCFKLARFQSNQIKIERKRLKKVDEIVN